ncbi:hypothetical protein BC831DRAFT_256646 [Entophlyctis helioformis]|nr:hypothetical protein BC831DRAFT_256646 [Entophlyctis helioformis]
MAQTTLNVEVYANRLNDADVDNKVKVAIVTELRDSIEIVQSVEYPRFLAFLLPVFISILSSVEPSLFADTNDNKVRNIILEIIHRFPNNDALKSYAQDLMKVLMSVLRTDNEENAVICLKIIVDLHKNYKTIVEDYVQPFLDTVQEMYQNMEKAVADAFGDDGALDAGSLVDLSGSAVGGEPQSKKALPLSLFSFKVLTECPIIIALLFQIHRKFVPTNVPLFVPLIVKVLLLQPPQQAAIHKEADAQSTVFLGMAPSIKNAAVYGEFKSLQVKTVSFVAYILRSFISLLKPYEADVANAVVCLMKDCPADASATRKELLVATRHLWYTEFRIAFVKHLDLLLNESILVGSGVTCRETLRPLAHSVLIDLIHHVRNELTIEQITKIIHIYSRNLHDPAFPLQIQTMCAKLLLSLIDNVITQQSRPDARRLLIRTLDAFACRLGSIHAMYPTVVHYLKRKGAAKDTEKPAEENYSVLMDMDGFLDIGSVQPIRTCTRPLDNSTDLIKEMRVQIKSILLGIKTTLFALRSHPQPFMDESAQPMTNYAFGDEVDIFVRIFKDGLHCFAYFAEHDTGALATTGSATSAAPTAAPTAASQPAAGATASVASVVPSKEDKDVLEAFASIFTFVDPPIFQEVFTTHIDHLFDHSVRNPAVLVIPQYFLANQSVSANFSGLLLNFLVGRLADLGGADVGAASVMLRLFKLLFMAVTLFPETNETVLRPHLSNIIMSSLRLSAKAKDPINYFSLLRALFRSIGGGRFELLYQEVLPLLQVLLETLNALLASAHQPQMKELFVELCLTVPVRLSVLLPYLSYLMRPLVIALQAGPDLVTQSLRTLELCVDNLNHEFLEPMLNPVIDDLMTALWKHLKPNPYNPSHSHTTLRILGKFGGRNRRWLRDKSALEYLEAKESALNVELLLHGSTTPQGLSLDEVLRVAESAMRNDQGRLRAQAFQFARACLPLLVDLDDNVQTMAAGVQANVTRFSRRYETENAAAASAATATASIAATTSAAGDVDMLDASQPDQPSSQSQQTPGQSAQAPSASSTATASPFADLDERIPRRRKNALDEALTSVLGIIFTAAATADDLRGDAWAIVDHLCMHFAVISIGEAGLSSAIPLAKRVGHYGSEFLAMQATSTLNGFLEAIVLSIASDNEARRELAERIVTRFYEICLMLVGSKDRIDDVISFHILATRFSSCCFQSEWFKKTGGCLGILLLSSKLAMSPRWMLDHELEFVKALLYVLKDVAADVAYFDLDTTTETLSLVLKICNSAEHLLPEAERSAKLNSLVSLLMSELSNANAAVRETIQKALKLLADLTDNEVTEILRPVCERLLSPIFAKPLRALPFALQIGHIDAITYCLCLNPPLLSFNDELLRLLNEALALADAEDQALVSKTSQFKSAASLNNLRVVCIKLLTAAVSCQDFVSPRHNSLRPRIISVFFKSLYSKSADVVDAANKGLEEVVSQQHKLPKELLQAGLRPILVNLADHKRLTVAGLEGLAKLLQLLTNYFKVEIGKKLLDHLRQWANPTLLEDISGRPITEVDEVKVIVAILDIFHLLPPTANIFMDDLVKHVLELEARVHRSISSPFRRPLTTFINKYATEAVEYFLDRLAMPQESALFIGLLTRQDAQAFRSQASKSADLIISKVFTTSEEADPLLYRNGVQLVRQIMADEPNWLLENRAVLEAIRNVWRRGVMKPLSSMSYIRGRDPAATYQLFIEYCKLEPDNIDVLFDVFEGFMDPELIDTGFLKQFVFTDIGPKLNPSLRRAILQKYLDIYPNQDVSIQHKTCLMRYLITPMLLLGSDEDARVVDAGIVESILVNIWTPIIPETPGATASDLDALKIELLQLTTLLVHKVPEVISESRKDVIKFAWNHLKVEDVTLKQSAYVLLSRFIREYETPVKIVSQIYVALLRGHQSEGRILVKQALDTLIPVLPLRFGPTTGERSRMPVWVQWIRKIIVEEGHTISQLLAIYQLVIRNADQFYSSREHFLPQIVSALAKLGLSGSASAETRSLTLDLSDLILRWEKRESAEMAAFSADADGSAVGQSSAPHDGMDWASTQDAGEMSSSSSSSNHGGTASLNYKEMVVNYLVRFALSLSDPQSSKALPQRAIDTFARFMTAWPDVPVKINQIEKVVTHDDDTFSAIILHAIDILRIVVENKPTDWTYANLALLRKCIGKWIRSEEPSLIKPIHSIVASIWRAVDAHGTGVDNSSEERQFFELIDSIIQQGLRTLTNIQSIISLLEASCLTRLDQPTAQTLLSTYFADVVRLLEVVIKDVSGTQPATPLNESTVAILKTILELLNKHISQLGDTRKTYIQGIMTVLDLQGNPELHRLILDMLRKWIFETPRDSFPTLKERASVAIKMLAVCRTEGSTIAEDYMNLVADVYESPLLARSELTVRLETAFLEGTRSANPDLRRRFHAIMDRSLQTGFQIRLNYVLSVQNWESLASTFWIRQALELLMGSINTEATVQNQWPSLQRIPSVSGFDALHAQSKTEPPATETALPQTEMQVDAPMEPLSAELLEMVGLHVSFGQTLCSARLSTLIDSIRAFIQDDIDLAFSLWSTLFPMFWSLLSSRERHDVVKGLVSLLARDYHMAQATMRPNVIQALLRGACKCVPPVQLPPQLVRHLGRTYNAWHIALELLQTSMYEVKTGIITSNKEEEKIRDSVMDSLADLYADLSEDDYFYGLWRRKCLFVETNAAVSFEQIGMWGAAQQLYESAQHKARTGVLPFTEFEYCLWESHWIECAQRLQQWEILTDLAKHDSNPELLLECAWRLSDWTSEREPLALQLQNISEPPTARKKMFQAFLALQNPDMSSDFQRLCDDGIQLVLQRWFALPDIVSSSHVATFHSFQQFVELQEAAQIQNNLLSTTASNIDVKSQELKGILQTWRERLPNIWDDINMWSDLVAWRQHIFTAINKAYLPLIPQLSQPMAGGNPSSSYAYRGYHETAWIINRFAHVARKHQLPEVCINSLSKIYTLPNIEIQEAFYKLREQAKCHLRTLGEYSTGLDVINNTNLLYFTPTQKAEFFTLKGQFLAKLNLNEDAIQAFSSAIHIDMELAKAWASWGEYNDRLFAEQPMQMEHGVDAINCYLHAAGIYNNARSRKFLARILWLLSLDDDTGTLSKSPENYKSEIPVWYWVTFVPQLILALAGKESVFARQILIRIAKSFPQALHFQLRTAKEDHANLKKQMPPPPPPRPAASAAGDKPASSVEAGGTGAAADGDSTVDVSGSVDKSGMAGLPPGVPPGPPVRRPPWEIIDEITGLLKTAFALLALSMETMVDQILQRLKPTTDEDIYRLIVALLSDGVQMYLQHMARDPNEGGTLSAATENNLIKFAESMQPNHLKYKHLFEHDFITSKPTLSQLVERFRYWRDNLEVILDRRPRVQYLEHFSHYLAEFEYQKFDEIEVPGQYFELKSNNKDFVKIDRFAPTVDAIRGHIYCYKSLTIRGHNGSMHRFIVQHPAARHCRRDERILQLFRIFNEAVIKKKDTRRLNLSFSVPIIVPLAPQIRLVEDDGNNITLQDIYEDHCRRSGLHKDDHIVFHVRRMRQIYAANEVAKKGKVEMLNLKTEVMEEIARKMIPETIVSKYFHSRMASYLDLWTFRKRFTTQLATMTFMTYLMSIGHRHPQKVHISLKTGSMWSSDLLPTISNTTSLFSNNEAVPFRFTPNMQNFVTPVGIEGVLVASLMAVGRSLTQPEVGLSVCRGPGTPAC